MQNELKIVMIHEITPNVLKTDLSDFDIITFDDGLYTQYLHHEHFAEFGKPMYFFISTGIVSNGVQSSEVIYCGDAHIKARNKNFENYMTWDQIKELDLLYNIGGHSHTHPMLKKMSLKDQIIEAKFEIKTMMETFKNQNIKIDSFCFPYNDDIIGYRAYLKNVTFFGRKRIPVENL